MSDYLDAALQAERDALRDGGGVPRVVDALHLSTGRLVTAKEVESLQVTNLDGWTLAISRGVRLDEATTALEALREQVEGLVKKWRDQESFGYIPRSDDEFSGVLIGRGICADELAALLAIK